MTRRITAIVLVLVISGCATFGNGRKHREHEEHWCSNPADCPKDDR